MGVVAKIILYECEQKQCFTIDSNNIWRLVCV